MTNAVTKLIPALFTTCLATAALAETQLPDAVTASPDVYKILAENDSIRVIEATWQPGQRDEMHAHPPIGVYFLSACDGMKVHFADGSSSDWAAPQGAASTQEEITAHSIENAGSAVCHLVFVEPK